MDNFTVELPTAKGPAVELSIWDTAGQEEYARLRSLSYPGADVFVCCFSISSPASLEHVVRMWGPELRVNAPGVPILLCGLKTDLRDDPKTVEALAREAAVPVTALKGEATAQEIKAHGYRECSAMLKTGIQEVFQEAVEVALRCMKTKKPAKKKKGGCCVQ